MRLLHIRVKLIVLTSIAKLEQVIDLLKIKSQGKRTISDFKKYEANLSVYKQPQLKWVRRFVPSFQIGKY